MRCYTKGGKPSFAAVAKRPLTIRTSGRWRSLCSLNLQLRARRGGQPTSVVQRLDDRAAKEADAANAAPVVDGLRG